MDSKSRYRIYLSVFFFVSGVCFSTWASRIPTIKDFFQFNEAQLGTVLLFMPISSLIGLPVSGFLVSRFDSRVPMSIAFVVNAVALALIGIADTRFELIASLCLFSFSMRIFNISVNTQSVTLQKMFEKRIIGSFHGLWSLGGIVGVGISTLLVAQKVPMYIHLFVVAMVAIIATFVCYNHLITNDRAPTGNKLIIGKPDPYIFFLGVLVFLAAICEGGMFDWSGIFFKEVVKVELFTLGYLTFMVFMSLSRFASDRIIEMIGMPKTYIMSASFISTGILLAVAFPSFWFSLIGFCMVGFGTAAIIPMTYLLAGASKKYSPGLAISVIATFGIVGMLIGPPMIGYIAHAFNLRIAFVAFAVAGVLLIPVSQMFFNYQRKPN